MRSPSRHLSPKNDDTSHALARARYQWSSLIPAAPTMPLAPGTSGPLHLIPRRRRRPTTPPTRWLAPRLHDTAPPLPRPDASTGARDIGMMGREYRSCGWNTGNTGRTGRERGWGIWVARGRAGWECRAGGNIARGGNVAWGGNVVQGGNVA